LRKKAFAALGTFILIAVVWLASSIDSTLGYTREHARQYSWTDTIILYKHATSVCTDIRTFTNNETFPIDVQVHITHRSGIHILQHYKLSANGTDFIIISEGKVILSGATYYGLGPGQKLSFTVEAKPTDLAVVGDTATVDSIVMGIPQHRAQK